MRRQILAVLIPLLSFSRPTFSGGLAVSARFSSLGLGVEAVKSLTPAFNARVSGNFFNYSLDGVQGEEISYDLKLKMRTASLLLDWYPFDKTFRLCAGGYYNENKMDITVKSATSHTMGGKTYQPDELGKVTGEVGFPSIAPYIGIGLGNAVAEGKRFSMMIDVGMIYQNSPQLSLVGEGLIAPTAEQEPLIEDNLSWVKWYPYFSIGFAWKF